MKYPYLKDVPQSRDITTYFSGYNHTYTCQEGEFFDTQNISTKDFPVFSTRTLRGIDKEFENLQGIIDKDSLVWIDNKQLYIDNELKDTSNVEFNDEPKTMVKMGAYIAIFPDKIWYNAKDNTYGYMESSKSIASGTSVTFSAVKPDATNITAAMIYSGTGEPTDGQYKITTSDGKTYWQVYSKTTGMWANVATTYMKIQSAGIGTNFKKGDGVKISVTFANDTQLPNFKNIFVNEDENNKLNRNSNFAIYDKGDDYITVVGILGAASTTLNNITVDIERKAPDISYACECQNRIWACSKDGHEIYCCKQGDVTNWNCFAGISTDSWTATVGSDGVFTGAYAYLGYPIFFKENSLLRVTVSNYGAHSYKEIVCRGVQEGSGKSLVMLNELLYYKSPLAICYYDGNFPQEIDDKLGEVRYKNAVAGSVDNRYYISMQDANDDYHVLVYDVKTHTWVREDDTKIDFFTRHGSDLFFVSDNRMYSVGGTTLYEPGKEKDIKWYAESGNIGYTTPDKKYVSRIDVKMSLELGSEATFWINYDSTNTWIALWSMSGRKDKTFAIPVRPNRCEHFRYKITGKGPAKIFSITKALEEGSDM